MLKDFMAQMRAERTTHERRQFSLQVAGVLTALLFVGWVGTLGLRLAMSGTAQPSNNQNAAATLEAVQSASASSSSTILPGYSGYQGY